MSEQWGVDKDIITLDGREYKLGTKLRTAYQLQKQFGNKPYMELFQDIGKRGVEQQIKFIYTAFVQGYKEAGIVEEKPMPLTVFEECMLDHFGIMGIVDCIQAIIEGVTRGDMSETEFEERKAKNSEARTEQVQE